MSGPGGVMAALDRGEFFCGAPDSEISQTRGRILALVSALERARELLELIAHISPLDEPKAGSVGEEIRTALAGFYGTAVPRPGGASGPVMLLQLLVGWNHDPNGSGDELGRLCAAAEGMVGRALTFTTPANHGSELLADAGRWAWYVEAMTEEEGTKRAALRAQAFPKPDKEAWDGAIDAAMALDRKVQG